MLPTPTTVQEVRGFISTCSYYRRFIPNFSKIAEPLIDLTRMYARFKWTPCCQKAFDLIKESLTVVPLLAYQVTNKPYNLYTDASDNCNGACLWPTEQMKEKVSQYITYLTRKMVNHRNRGICNPLRPSEVRSLLTRCSIHYKNRP